MIGSLLLDGVNRYLVDGKLPPRPKNDKELLKHLVKACEVTAMDETSLPVSLRKRPWWARFFRVKEKNEGRLAIRIKDIANSDVILVNRTRSRAKYRQTDKHFRFTNYKCLGRVEVWVKKEAKEEEI